MSRSRSRSVEGMRRALGGDLKKAYKRARKLGIEVELTGSNHVRWSDPTTGAQCITALTPSSRGPFRKVTRFLDQVEGGPS